MKPVHEEIWGLSDSVDIILMKCLGQNVQSEVFYGPMDDVFEDCISHIFNLHPYQKAITR